MVEARDVERSARTFPLPLSLRGTCPLSLTRARVLAVCVSLSLSPLDSFNLFNYCQWRARRGGAPCAALRVDGDAFYVHHLSNVEVRANV